MRELPQSLRQGEHPGTKTLCSCHRGSRAGARYPHHPVQTGEACGAYSVQSLRACTWPARPLGACVTAVLPSALPASTLCLARGHGHVLRGAGPGAGCEGHGSARRAASQSRASRRNAAGGGARRSPRRTRPGTLRGRKASRSLRVTRSLRSQARLDPVGLGRAGCGTLVLGSMQPCWSERGPEPSQALHWGWRGRITRCPWPQPGLASPAPCSLTTGTGCLLERCPVAVSPAQPQPHTWAWPPSPALAQAPLPPSLCGACCVPHPGVRTHHWRAGR